MSVKVKICGVTTIADAQLAVDLGADLLGLNFYKPSPRYISPDKAGAMVAQLAGNVLTAGVFVNATTSEIAEVVSKCRLDFAQLHGDETNQQCQEVKQLGVGVIKAFRVRSPGDIEQAQDYQVDAILLDAFHEEMYGGSGEKFDWGWVKRTGNDKVFLAGGINPDNVAEAIAVGTYGVDLCSGVEKTPGIKDPDKMRLLFERIAASGA
ncbi:MAG: phosphoribosylanthranilate isomerase [Sedimentisphaerales bacterium]|nr:phosphoribosylanthranilate isomerase [Sedimentisphaerales bacterium]